LVSIFAAGGLGLGINFSAILGHLTTVVPEGYAPDISVVTATTAAIGGALGVATFGSLYLGLDHAGPGAATHAFAIVSVTFAATALSAWLSAKPAAAERVRLASTRQVAELRVR
jgi:hypothetical protein